MEDDSMYQEVELNFQTEDDPAFKLELYRTWEVMELDPATLVDPEQRADYETWLKTRTGDEGEFD